MGGMRNLIAPMSVEKDHIITPWTKKGTLVRVSVGLEDPQDLWSEMGAYG